MGAQSNTKTVVIAVTGIGAVLFAVGAIWLLKKENRIKSGYHSDLESIRNLKFTLVNGKKVLDFTQLVLITQTIYKSHTCTMQEKRNEYLKRRFALY
jgi:hypothetical protein